MEASEYFKSITIRNNEISQLKELFCSIQNFIQKNKGTLYKVDLTLSARAIGWFTNVKRILNLKGIKIHFMIDSIDEVESL